MQIACLLRAKRYDTVYMDIKRSIIFIYSDDNTVYYYL